jgi:hypothetical protein
VLLSDCRKGHVVDVKPDNPRYPQVQPLGALPTDGKIRILKTSQKGVHILRPLAKDELE